MKCPICGGKAIVYDTRYKSKKHITKRRRECVECLTQIQNG
jgi:transcriptional regulator NrdR family protein